MQARVGAEEQLEELRRQVAPLADMLEAATKLAQASETGVSRVCYIVILLLNNGMFSCSIIKLYQCA